MEFLSPELIEKLKFLADKYEKPSFVEDDPSRVLTRYKNRDDIESAAFISAILAFGQRQQFLKKLEIIFLQAEKYGGPAAWLKNGTYLNTFFSSNVCKKPDSLADASYSEKFYRFYSYLDMIKVFDRLSQILNEYGNLGNFFEKQSVYDNHLSFIICEAFCECSAIPHGRNSANKRINMFLRWMVRQKSSVDLGLWAWYDPKDLIIPLDTHVLQVAMQFSLLPPKSSGTWKTAVLLTDILKQVWPNDPCKGDFALFGLGVDINKE